MDKETLDELLDSRPENTKLLSSQEIKITKNEDKNFKVETEKQDKVNINKDELKENSAESSYICNIS